MSLHIQAGIALTDITSLLKKADSIRTSNRQEFNRIVDTLWQSNSEMTVSQQMQLNYLRGYQLSIKGNLDEALNLLDKVIDQDAFPELKYRAIITKVNIYTFSENYGEGFTLLNRLIPLLPQIKESDSLQNALFVIAMFYNRLSQWSLSKYYSDRLLSSNPSSRFACLASMLDVEAKYKLSDLTWKNINDNLLHECEASNEIIASNIIHTQVAKFYIDNFEADKAINLLEKHISSAESTQYYMLISEFNSLLALAFYSKHEFYSALNYAQKVLSSAKPEHKSEAIIRANKVYYLVNKELGNFEAALKYHEQYEIQRHKISTDNNRRFVSYQIAQKAAQEKELTIQMLDERNKVLNLEKQLIKNENNRKQLLNILLGIIIIALIIWAFRSRQLHLQLEKLANYDELTGVFNRRCFNTLAKSAINYYSTTNQQLSLLLFDLDNFKQINDQYGHHVGDWVLKQALQTCSELSRKNDIIGRFGGEEFIILLPGCSQDKAIELANRYRLAINNIQTSETGFEFEISASFGLFSSSKRYELSQNSLENIIQFADKAMYHSKSHGRNRVSVYGVDIN